MSINFILSKQIISAFSKASQLIDEGKSSIIISFIIDSFPNIKITFFCADSLCLYNATLPLLTMYILFIISLSLNKCSFFFNSLI